ncbi:ferrous iron transport protein A [bacterium]|nr:ferrous iron transport protein A [bacterium]
MATSAKQIDHNHSHEAKLTEGASQTPNADGTWIHSHYHTHNYSHGYGQSFIFDHRHAHRHGKNIPKHALTDMKPEDRAIIRAVIGRPAVDCRLLKKQINVGDTICRVNTADSGQSWQLELNGNTHTITADEASAIIVEVQ